MEVGYVIIFRTEGLDLEGMLNELKLKGCTIVGVSEDYCTLGDIPCTTVFLKSSFAVYVGLNLKLNLLEDPNYKWHFHPMESLEEKIKAKSMMYR